MEPALKTRLIGAAVLVALAVIIVPMFFSGQSPKPGNGKSMSLALPPAPDQELTTRTMSVASPPAAASVATAASAPADSGHLATVDIASRKPQEVHPENDASTTPAAARATPAGDQAKATPSATKPKPAPAAMKPASRTARTQPAAKQTAPAPGKAAHGAYMISLGAYSNSANARDLMRRVHALHYPVHADKVTIGDKIGARISVGPFATRAAAETARLRLKQSIPSAPARLEAAASDQHGDAPASALPSGRAGGWAVQLGAYSHKADAQALDRKLHASGFDGYIDSVQSGGRTLWRVRVGPQTQRADAEKLRDEVKAKLKMAGVVVTVP
jgi:DedD protein